MVVASERERGHELGMPVALHDLGGDGRRSQIEDGHGDLLHLRIDVGVVAHGARRSCPPTPAARPAAAARRPRSTSKAHNPSTMPKVMGSACTPWVRPIMTVSRCSRARRCRMRPNFDRLFLEQRPGRPQLQGQPGVEHVGRGEPVVDVLGALADVLGDATDEGDDVVLGGLLDLADPVDVEGGLCLDLRQGVFGDLCPNAPRPRTRPARPSARPPYGPRRSRRPPSRAWSSVRS